MSANLTALLAGGLQLARLPAFVTEFLEGQGYRVFNLVPADALAAGLPMTRFYPALVALAVAAMESGERVAVVTLNYFVKRAIGAPLRMATPDRVLDISGCYVPGIGSPMVVLLGGRLRPTGTVAVVLGLAGEPGPAPRDPQFGRAWQELVAHWDDERWHGQFFTVLHPGVHGWAHAYLTRGDAESLDRTLDAVRTHRDALVLELERIAALAGSAEESAMAAVAQGREPQSARYGVEYAVRQIAERARTALEGVRRG